MRRRRFIPFLGGLALAWPLAVIAQQPGKERRIGVLLGGFRAPPSTSPLGQVFVDGLRDQGPVEGQNITIEWRPAEGRLERLPALAAELVAMKVDAIVVLGPAPIHAAKLATQTIPIVMLAGSPDPVGEGLITSFARPGGNITGLTFAASPERFGKQLELLREAIPSVSRIGILWDLDIALYRQTYPDPLQQAASGLGLTIMGPFQVLKVDDFEPAFAAMVEQRVDAVLILAGSILFPSRERVAELAIRHRLATMTAIRAMAQAGSMINYGPDFSAIYRRGAYYVARVLHGANPAELPVEQPAKYELVVNLRTARALGIDAPPALLVRADEVIE